MKYFLVLLSLLTVFSWPPLTSSHTFTDPRDGQTYAYIPLGELDWMRENLRFQTELGMAVSGTNGACGTFYLLKEALTVCPTGWRLPTEREVKALIKLDKRKKLDLLDTLQIHLCGRIDGKHLAREGEQNTFWLDAPIDNGYIMHWHSFGREHELHSHNVVNAKRQFPVRCVRARE